jgi:DNA-binding XRE family transcriptional regulator
MDCPKPVTNNTRVKTPAPPPGKDIDLGKTNVEAFNENTFYEKFTADIQRANESIIIHSPFITERGSDRWRPLLQKAINRGVRVCLYVPEPTDWSKRNRQDLPKEVRSKLMEYEAIFDQLLAAGIHLNLRQKIHEKMSVIDDTILWTGSLNILSHRDTSESMMRFVSRQRSWSAIAQHGLDTCSVCHRRRLRKTIPKANLRHRLSYIAKVLRQRRIALGIKQEELAKMLGVDGSMLSRFERGKRNLSSELLVQLSCLLGYELMLVPDVLRAAAEDLVHRRMNDPFSP